MDPLMAAEGGARAASDRATASVGAACPNCGAALSGPYCSQCGQRASARLISVREIFRDTLEDQFSWNSSVPRTLHALLLQPGHLTCEYVAGRIARYIPPMRIYLGASLLFFLTLSFVASPDRLASGENFQVVTDTPDRAAPDRTPAPTSAPAPAARAGRADQPAPPTAAATAPKVAPPASAARAAAGAAAQGRSKGFISVDTTAGPEWLRARLAAQARRLNAMDQRTALRTLLSGFWSMAPKVAFLLLPVLALILKLLYVRRGRLYVEHFVFALHVQSVAFLAFTVVLLLRNGWVGLAALLTLTAYTYVAMLRVYSQGWFRTLLKLGLLSWTYFVVLSAGMVVGLLATVLTV